MLSTNHAGHRSPTPWERSHLISLEMSRARAIEWPKEAGITNTPIPGRRSARSRQCETHRFLRPTARLAPHPKTIKSNIYQHLQHSPRPSRSQSPPQGGQSRVEPPPKHLMSSQSMAQSPLHDELREKTVIIAPIQRFMWTEPKLVVRAEFANLGDDCFFPRMIIRGGTTVPQAFLGWLRFTRLEVIWRILGEKECLRSCMLVV